MGLVNACHLVYTSYSLKYSERPLSCPMILFQARPRRYDRAAFEHEIRSHLGSPRPVRVLEAGCGRKWVLDLSGFDCWITGVDMDQRALQDRLVNMKDLNEAIPGDLLTVSLPAAGYDMVYCSYVLEHISGASEVMDRLFSWTKPGGLVVLRIPDRESAFGFVTRHTPQSLHVLVARRLLRGPNSRQGFGPYPTVYDKVVSRRGVHDYCAACGHEILVEQYSDIHGSPSWVFRLLARACIRAISVLSLGWLGPHDNLHFVIKRRLG